ncbi:hypothetical protein ANO11243_051160 [Dothideomycetidae sp. 11243]|nr:hypothetical protein ANO11243_051160 [fungal sp. No.11243]
MGNTYWTARWLPAHHLGRSFNVIAEAAYGDTAQKGAKVGQQGTAEHNFAATLRALRSGDGTTIHLQHLLASFPRRRAVDCIRCVTTSDQTHCGFFTYPIMIEGSLSPLLHSLTCSKRFTTIQMNSYALTTIEALVERAKSQKQEIGRRENESRHGTRHTSRLAFPAATVTLWLTTGDLHRSRWCGSPAPRLIGTPDAIPPALLSPGAGFLELIPHVLHNFRNSAS